MISNIREAGTTTTKTLEMLDIFERKILRRIHGPFPDGDTWRIRFNNENELYQLYREPKHSMHIDLIRPLMGMTCSTTARDTDTKDSIEQPNDGGKKTEADIAVRRAWLKTSA